MDEREWFRRALEADVVAAAPLLLGWELVHGPLRARIVEVEAYRTPDDAGCHAHRGRTPKVETMFSEAGRAYVYFTYGNHWMLNVVGFPEGAAAAILIRAAEPVDGMETFWERRPKARRVEDLLSGPGKLTAAFGVDRRLDGVDLLDGREDLRLEPGVRVSDVAVGVRIGLAEGKGDLLPWRFIDRGRMLWASRPWL